MYTIVDLFYENGFLGATSLSRWCLRSPFGAKHINDSMFIKDL